MKIYIWTNRLCTTYRLVLHKMQNFLTANNAVLVESYNDADYIVMATCGGFYSEIDNFFASIATFSDSNARIVVYGCLPLIIPNQYAAFEQHVYKYIHTRHPEEIQDILEDIKTPWEKTDEQTTLRDVDYTRKNSALHFIVIQEGCNASCTFCPHKLGIGNRTSVPLETILRQTQRAVDAGAKTILLEGRDSGSWGIDLQHAHTYPELIRELLDIPLDFELFLNQLGANWAILYKAELAKLFLNERITDAWIPIQTTSKRLLQLMGRKEDVLDLEELLSSLSHRKTKLILKTDMLIGFPTETDEELRETLEFVAKYFDEVSIYGFELHQSSKIAQSQIKFHSQEIISRRVAAAIDYFRCKPEIIWHSAGQSLESEKQREQRKIAMGRK